MKDKGFSFIDFNESDPDPIFCPFCLKVDIKVKLVPQYYDIYERDIIDPDNFLQCPNNGNHLIPIYEGKTEVEYAPIIDMVDSPFDSGSEFKSTEKHSKKKRRRVKKQEVDKDIAAEQGTVNIVYDSQGNY